MSRILAVLCTFLSGALLSGQDAHGFGPVDPVLLPDVIATRHDGASVRIREVFAGRRSAVQFIFVDCTTACPLLGSLFRKVDRTLGSTETQLVSITVNPERDTPARLAAWLGQFHASSRWVGLRIEAVDLPSLLQAFKQEAGPPSGHTLQVFLVDAKARYVARTVELPAAAAIAAELRIGESWHRPLDLEPRPGSLAGRDIFAGLGGIVGRLGADRLDAHASRCSGCHGASAGGGGEGKTVVPPLTPEALTSERGRRGGPPSAYTERSFCEGLRRGIDPAGVRYSDLMPRYEIDGRTCHVLWRFLMEATVSR